MRSILLLKVLQKKVLEWVNTRIVVFEVDLVGHHVDGYFMFILNLIW